MVIQKVTVKQTNRPLAMVSVLMHLTPTGPWLAGGAARKLYLGSPLIESDLDIFCANADQSAEIVLFLLENGASEVGRTENNITYKLENIKVQVITGKFYPTHLSVLASFDFHLCQFLFDGTSLFTTEEALNDLQHNMITVNKVTLPLYSLARVAKYYDQGFTAAPFVLLQLAREAQEQLIERGEGGGV